MLHVRDKQRQYMKCIRKQFVIEEHITEGHQSGPYMIYQLKVWYKIHDVKESDVRVLAYKSIYRFPIKSKHL